MTIPTTQEIYGLLGVFEVACTHGDLAAQFTTKGELLDALASVFAELERAERDAERWRYAKKNLRVGEMLYDHLGNCNCDFSDRDEAFIDAALAAQEKP